MTPEAALEWMVKQWPVIGPDDVMGTLHEVRRAYDDGVIWVRLVESNGRVHNFPCSKVGGYGGD